MKYSRDEYKLIPKKRKTTEEGGSPQKEKKNYSTPLMYEALTHKSANTYHGAAPLLSPCSLDIFFCLRKFNETATSLYSINVEANRPHKVYPESLLIPFWKGKLPANGFLAAALGSHSHIYCFSRGKSPTRGIRDVYKLRVTPHIAKEWVPIAISPLISPDYHMKPLVSGGKLYVSNYFSYHNKLFSHWGEVFDPTDEKWEAVPNPPIYPWNSRNTENSIIISAVLENPDRIIAAYRVPNEPNEGYYYAIFYAYNVQHKHWEKLKPSKRELVFFDEEDYLHVAHVCVNNTLYWIKPGMGVKDDLLFIAYDLDLDMWLQGCLNGFGRFFFQDYSLWDSDSGYRPAFIHLEKQRFCLLQRSEDYGYLRYLVIEISRMPNKRTLGISVLWDHKFEMEPKTSEWWRLSSCFVM
jgi:hypothetical protein